MPKAATTSESFVLHWEKILIDNSIKYNFLIRNDYKTRAIIKIIEDYNLNEQPKCLDYKILYNYENDIIKNNNNDLNEIELLNIYKKK